MPPDPSQPSTATVVISQPSWMAPVTPVVPDHELVRHIGNGSYGDVWLARTAVGTWRAVKVVFHDRFTDTRPYEREFNGIRKFEPLSRSNEAFVDILQIGRNDAAGYFYYVMELADDAAKPPFGGTSSASPQLPGSSPPTNSKSVPRGTRPSEGLEPSQGSTPKTAFDPAVYSPLTLSKALVQCGRLPVSKCLELGLTLNLGLAHLHRAGLIHRDIKPSNIIFVDGVPKLADIGLVIEMTEAHSFVGTEGFIPPEGPNSPQADLFSLGKVLYEAGMGKDRKDFPEPLTQIAEAENATEILEFNAILLKACAANREERYQSAEEMNADLALLQSGGSVRRQRKLAGQLRFVQRAGAIVTAIAALAAGLYLWQAKQTRVVREFAAQKSQLAEEKTRLAEENRERIVRLAIANGNHLLEEDDPAGALLWFAEALPLLTNHPAAESIHRIRIQQTLNHVPRVLQVLPHESGLCSATFSPDGRLIVTGTQDGNVRVWNARDGTLKWGPRHLPTSARFCRFTHDGKRLLLSCSAEQGTFNGSLPPVFLVGILDAETGEDWKWATRAFEDALMRPIGGYFSPDDRWLATAHGDGVIRVFDLENGRRTLELREHTKPVLFVSFSGNGRVLASACADHAVRLWQLPTGEPIGRPLLHRWPVVRVLLTDDASHAITVGWENVGDDGGAEVHVWDTASGERLPQPVEVRDRIALFLAPGSDGPLFVQDRAPHLARVYQLETGQEASLDLAVKGIRSWDFTKDGSRLALGLGNHVARVLDARDGSLLTSPLQHGGWGVNTVQFSPSGSELLTGCEDGTVRIWDLCPRAGEVARANLPGGLQPGYSLRGRQEFGRSGSEFAVHAPGRATVVFDDHLRVVHQFEPDQPTTDILSALLAPDGKCWALYVVDRGSGNSVGVRLGIKKDGAVQEIDLPHPDTVGDVNFSPDSAHVISACADNRIRFWSASDGSLERIVSVPQEDDGGVTSISPDGRTALWRESSSAGSAPKSLMRFFDLDSGTFIGASREVTPTVDDGVFSPTGQYVALMDRSGPVTVLESRTGRAISTAIRHPGTLNWLQWDFAGRRLLTTGDSDEVRIWDLADGAHLALTLRASGSTVSLARWSPDGRFVVGNCRDHKVRVWDAATGEMVTPPLSHQFFIGSAAILPGNRLISVAYVDEALRAWDLTEARGSTDLLGDYAMLAAGRRVNVDGVMVSMKPDKLTELSRSLRSRAPELFQ